MSYDQPQRPAFTPHPQNGAPWPTQDQRYGPPPQQQPAYGQMQPAVYDQRGYAPPPQQPGPRAQRHGAGKRYALRGAEGFWYVLGCIAFGAAYFSKIPAKKAACEVFSELQLDGQGRSRSYSLRGMEGFWYVLMCLGFGAGYFAKVSAKKALWELVGMVQAAPGEYAEAIGRALLSRTGPAMPHGPQY
jgi:hypothetical protein